MAGCVCCRLSQDTSCGEVRLLIARSVIGDAGSYSVRAGEATSRLHVDVISERPVFTEQLTDQTLAVPGRPVTFTATVRGLPRPRIRWMVAGADVSDAADMYRMSCDDDGRAELTLLSVSASDVGLSIECRASSEAGEAVSVASLVPGRSRDNPVGSAWSARTVRVAG